MSLVPFRSQWRVLPKSAEKIMCGDSAARYLKLTSVRPPLSVYSMDPRVKPDEWIRVYRKEIPEECVIRKNGRAYTNEVTLLKDLFQGLRADPQTILESIAMLQDNYQNILEEIKLWANENGYGRKYDELEELANEWK